MALAGWSNYLTVSLPSTSGDETDVHFKVKINKASGMNSDFSDIRIVDSDGETVLSQYRSSYTSSYAWFWFKVPSKPAAGKTIYIYYNNSSASLVSSLNTFGESLDADDYSEYEGDPSGLETALDGAGYSISSGIALSYTSSQILIELQSGTNNLLSDTAYGQDHGIFIKCKIMMPQGGNSKEERINIGFSAFTGYWIGANPVVAEWRSNSVKVDDATELTSLTSYDIEVRRSHGVVQFLLNNTLEATDSDDDAGDLQPVFGLGQGTNLGTETAAIYLDSYFVYKISTSLIVEVMVCNFKGAPLEGVNPLQVSFADLSSKSPTSWAWDFGDGETSTEQHPTHTYAAKGLYDVTLEVANNGESASETKLEYINAICYNLDHYMHDIQIEMGEALKHPDLPLGIMAEWVTQDLKNHYQHLSWLLNNYYKRTAMLAVTSALGGSHSSIDHTSGETEVSGFSGLTPDQWIDGSVLVVSSNVYYSAKIADNDATTLTLYDGDDLPALSSATVFLTANNSNASVSLTGLTMMRFVDPLWMVADGKKTIEKIPADLVDGIGNIPGHNGKVFYYVTGQQLNLVFGSGASCSGSILVGYYKTPDPVSALTDCIDLPPEYRGIAKMLTQMRVRIKKGDYKEAKRINNFFVNTVKLLKKSAVNFHHEDEMMDERN